MEINFKPTKKQFEAWKYLTDNNTTEILYGGSAGSGKSMLGCAWLIINCIAYPGTRYLMGRSKLNTLKMTTLKTFNDIITDWGLREHITINNQNNTIYFSNGSEILMKDLFTYPSDPDFDSLGSLEITGAFIDEISQISYKAFEIIQTRIRYKLNEYKLVPKLFSSCNPSRGWLYTEFYKPYIDGDLKPYRKFIPALATDNEYIDSNYITQLRKASKSVQERLLYGNWDYSDDIDSLFKYEDLVKMKDIPAFNAEKPYVVKNRYISCDIARLGKDSTVIMLWEDLTVIDVITLDQVTTDVSASRIKELMLEWRIPIENIVVDADGIGGSIVDQLKGIRPFINNSSQIIFNNSPKIYQNLKAQCYYLLSEKINDIKIKCSNEIFEDLCQELQVIKQKDIDSDGKLAIIPKDQMKKVLGRSPDYADAMMFRMIYEIRPKINDGAFDIKVIRY